MEMILFGELAVMALPATAAPFIYHKRFDWTRSIQGKSTMLLLVSLLVLVDLAFLFQVVPGFPGKLEIAIAVYALLIVALTFWCVMAVRTKEGSQR